MPIQFKKTPVTLQEKIDKAIDITYHIKDSGDAYFLRKFLIELMEKAFLKVNPEDEIMKKIDQLKENEL